MMERNRIFANLDTIIRLALEEDLGRTGDDAGAHTGDVTSDAIFSESDTCTATLFSKATGILAGIDVFRSVFDAIDEEVRFEILKNDGDTLEKGDRVIEISGRTRSVLRGERTALNFLGFMSGIATMSSKYAQEAAKGGQMLVLDTRKTLPGYRELSKYAVRTGGASNHRMGLHDMVMIKDNHIDAAGSIGAAVERVRRRHGSRYRIEVECRNQAEVMEALESGADVIMLDNMSTGMMKEAVNLVSGRSETEASGGIVFDRIREISETGVDFVSVGALTHSVTNFDFSLRVVI